jgi:hypothetical protein
MPHVSIQLYYRQGIFHINGIILVYLLGYFSVYGCAIINNRKHAIKMVTICV